MAQQKRREVSYNDLQGRIDGAAISSDKVRSDNLSRLALFRRVKGKVLEREQMRLQDACADDDKRRVTTAKKITANVLFVRELESESMRVKALEEPVPKDRMLVSGHVRSDSGEGIGGLTVRLEPEDRRLAQFTTSTTTDDDGYYMMRLGDTDGGGRKTKTAASMEAPEPLAATPKDYSLEARLTVLDTGKKIVAEPRSTVTFAPDTHDYRTIVVAEDKLPPRSRHECGITRFLGNARSRELHDLENEKKRCNISKIRPDAVAYFNTHEEATAIGYDYCAYCFPKGWSKR